MYSDIALRQLTKHISTNDLLSLLSPAQLLQLALSGGLPRSLPPATSPRATQHPTASSSSPTTTDCAAMEDRLPATSKLQPQEKTTLCIHTSPGPAQTPHALPQPAAADTTQPKPSLTRIRCLRTEIRSAQQGTESSTNKQHHILTLTSLRHVGCYPVEQTVFPCVGL